MYGNVTAGTSIGMSANFVTTAAATNIDMRNNILEMHKYLLLVVQKHIMLDCIQVLLLQILITITIMVHQLLQQLMF